MRNFYYKTYKFRSLIITVILDEITFLYKGKKRIYIKSIRKSDFLFPKKRYILLSSLLILLLTLSFLYYSKVNFNSDNNLFQNYDKQKNRLLLSKKTDFSVPEDSEQLAIRSHKVKRGETLSEIAQVYGVSMDTICGSNRLHSYDIIREGSILRIPNKDGILHKVKKGQNLVSIAKTYRASLKKIFAENSIKNFDFISPGKDIFIPDAKPLNIFPGFLWPTQNRYVTSSYGWRRHPINRRRHFHHGIDLRSKYQLIRSTKYGKVTFTGWLGGYGKAIIIAHPMGWKSLYGHLSKIIVKRGQYVKQGQFIARSGNTGYSSGPHLHFELIKNGRHKNPYKYLKYRK